MDEITTLCTANHELCLQQIINRDAQYVSYSDLLCVQGVMSIQIRKMKVISIQIRKMKVISSAVKIEKWRKQDKDKIESPKQFLKT